MLKTFVVGCILMCSIVLSVDSIILRDPAHPNDCYHPIVFKHFAINETIQTGRCSVATCKSPPFDIDETLCECGKRTINYKSGCYEGPIDYSIDYPACCERTVICV